jgi:hypothetical protein
MIEMRDSMRERMSSGSAPPSFAAYWPGFSSRAAIALAMIAGDSSPGPGSSHWPCGIAHSPPRPSFSSNLP